MSKQKWLSRAIEQKHLAKQLLGVLASLGDQASGKSAFQLPPFGDGAAIALFEGALLVTEKSALALVKEAASSCRNFRQNRSDATVSWSALDVEKEGSLLTLMALFGDGECSLDAAVLKFPEMARNSGSWLGQLCDALRLLNATDQSVASMIKQLFPAPEERDPMLISISSQGQAPLPLRLKLFLDEVVLGLEEELTQMRELGWEG